MDEKSKGMNLCSNENFDELVEDYKNYIAEVEVSEGGESVIDAHVHIEKGPYTEEWIMKFVDEAVKRGIDQLYLLEHSHRFREFRALYTSIKADTPYGRLHNEWLKSKFNKSIEEYKELIEKMRKKDMPIKVYYGLEVCYFPEKEELIKSVTSGFPWDFLTGSVHWIDGWGFDHPSTKEYWEYRNVDMDYKTYYEIMISLVESGIFSILAHPDSIKSFNYYPECDLSDMYYRLADCLKKTNMKAEFSSGLCNNFNHSELGMNRKLLKVMIDSNVEIITASDAHVPDMVGMNIKEANEILLRYYSGTENLNRINNK